MPGSVKSSLLSLILISFLAGSTGAQSQLVGDLNGDYKVNSKDLRILAFQWLDPVCLEPGCLADMDGADGVNMGDLALLANNWQLEQAHLIISEFLASNASQPPLEDGELLDGNGESSDWIEIYNPSGATVSLDGWYLTDEKDNLTKWQFPDGLEIEPGKFLLVFASDKKYVDYPLNYPYLDPGGDYHTNFELNQTGDYLALVAPDGNAIVHEYWPDFPTQLTDISYGLTQFATTLVPQGATASYHVPTSGDASLGTDWTAFDFDDSAWDTEKTGLGFGIGGVPTVAYNDSYGGGSTAANVTDWTIHNNDQSHNFGKLKDFATGSDVGMPSVTFTMGAEGLAVSTGAGGNPNAGTDAYEIFNNIVDLSGPLVYYGSSGWWQEIEFTDLNPASKYSFVGTAIRAENYPLRESLFTIIGHGGAVNNSSPGVVSKINDTTVMLAGDNSITGYVVRWDEIVPAGDGSFKVRSEATPTSDGGRAYPISGFMLEGGGSDSQVQTDMLGVNASLWSRIKFNVTDPGNYDTLSLRMKYEDGFVAYINGEEVARRNAPTPVEWNSTSDSNRPIQDALVFEEINLMSFLYVLQPGINVLAIHGLNDNKDNGDFLILPELVAARNQAVPQYFTTPTPRKFNEPGAIGLVEEVWLSHTRGFYDPPPFQLTLSTATKGAEIRYSIDSSTPTITNGNTYTSPLLIDKTTTLRAVAVKPGWLDSAVETHSYYFLDDVITQATDPVIGVQVVPPGYPTSWVSGGDVVTGDYQVDPDVVGQGGTDIFGGLYANTIKNDLKSVPTISVVMDKDDWFGSTGIYVNESQDGTERVASFEFLNPNTGEDFQLNCAIAMQGGVSGGGTSLNRWKVYKLSMRPRFKDSIDNGLPTGGPRKLDYQFFADSPVKRFDTIVLDAVLNNAWNHSSQHATAIYIQDQCVADFHNAMGGYSPHGYYTHVYINELYWGMYYLHERPDHSWAAEMFGGEKEEYDAIKHSLIYEAINDGGGYGSGSAVSNFNDMLDAADQVGMYTTATYNTLCEMLDVDNFITYILSHWYGVNWDWPQKNWYATHRHPNGKWRFHTWDAEHSLEWYNGNTVRGLSPYNIHDRLRDNVEYKMRFADIAHKALFNSGPLSSSEATEIVQNRMNQVDRAIVGESARWGDRRVSTPHTRQDLFDNLNSVLTGFISPRRSFLYDWLKDTAGLYPNVVAPVFYINGPYQHGGEVSAGDVLTMDTPPSGTIYYTTDGSDPREPWTGNPVGTPYSPITLNKSTHVKARVLNVSTWSALNEAIYSVGPLVDNLRITEIMYHPRNAGAPTDPNEEFIELKNIGTSTLNLNLVQFTEGIHFTFPDIDLEPGEHIVVMEDESAFEAKYGTSVNTAGQYIGSLANNGERIKLENAVGRTILDFEYKDGWHSIADGDGFSLTMMDPGDSSMYSSEGLVAHWKFDDGSGNTATDSAGTNNGALIGSPTWTTGRIDGALSFDGSGEYVVTAPIDPLAGDTFSAQAWIRVDESAGLYNSFLTQNKYSGGDGFYFYISNDRPDVYILGSSGSANANSTEALNADQWYLVAATNDGSNLKLYVDGQLKDTDSSAGLTGVNENANIGFEPISSIYYMGLIDDVRIYNRAISESEFQDMGDPMGRWSRKSSWRTSVYRNGTPGWNDSGILPNPGAIVINEVMAHSNSGPDWIELHNTTDEAINIGGWFLSDNNRDEPNLTKYRIANGTMIDSNDYLVFYQDTDFNNPGDPGSLVQFALSENGEEACLSSRLDPNGYLTGYRQVEDFGASQTNVSIGRYDKPSTGNSNFVAMDYNTPDANNAYPKVGPVVINEIMYNPPTGNQNEEYIELRNITGTLVTLYRYDKSAPWKFTDGIDYTFSAGPVVTIQAYGYLILAKDLTAFTAKHGVMPSGVQVLDGFDGKLSNAGERLQIGMPGDIDDEGTRYYIRIDRVTYSDGLHPDDVPGGVDLWPREADGLGKSLSRKVASDYGNDVDNWQAATPSPGVANP